MRRRIYNFSRLDLRKWGLSSCAVLHNWGNPDGPGQFANPQYRGIWSGDLYRAGKPPTDDAIRRAVRSTEGPLFFNGEWGSSWDGASYDMYLHAARVAFDECDGTRPIGIYNVPNVPGRPMDLISARWQKTIRYHFHRMFRSRDARGRFDATGAASFLSFACPGAYYGLWRGKRPPMRDYIAHTRKWFAKVHRQWQRPEVVVVSIEDHSYDEPTLMDPYLLAQYLPGVIDATHTRTAALWIRDDWAESDIEPQMRVVAKVARG